MSRGLSRFFRELGTFLFFVSIVYGLYLGVKFIFNSITQEDLPSSTQEINSQNTSNASRALEEPNIQFGISIDELAQETKTFVSSAKELEPIYEQNPMNAETSSLTISELKTEDDVYQQNKLPSLQELQNNAVTIKSVAPEINNLSRSEVEVNQRNGLAEDSDKCRQYPAEFVNLVNNGGYDLNNDYFEPPEIDKKFNTLPQTKEVIGLIKNIQLNTSNSIRKLEEFIKKLIKNHKSQGLAIITTNKCELDLNGNTYRFTFKSNNLEKFELQTREVNFLLTVEESIQKFKATHSTSDGKKYNLGYSPQNTNISFFENNQLLFEASKYQDKFNNLLYLQVPNKKNSFKINFQFGILNGPSTINYGANALEIDFIDGSINGVARVSQNKNLLAETEYQNNMKNGVDKNYNGNFLKRQTAFKNGEKEGSETIFWTNSKQIQFELNYFKGKKNGIENEYSLDGVMLRQTRYTDGLKDEKESIFDKDGKLVKEIIYLDGKPDIALFYKNNDVVDVQENF
tara:strand:+ start:5322 stop:6863 length:1542 start_codon:yes stop_codon:yes gene_type:complete